MFCKYRFTISQKKREREYMFHAEYSERSLDLGLVFKDCAGHRRRPKAGYI